MTPVDILTLISGVVVGFTLGVIGGGGSILALPLLLYVVGMKDPHVAIGTSALAVAANAFANLIQHARAGTVKWPCALVFGASGVIGALIGSTLGKMVAGQHLLVLFAGVMIVVGVSMLRGKSGGGDPGVRITRPIAVRLVAIGLLAGLLSGFFGIGGGFLIVPGIMLGSAARRLANVFGRGIIQQYSQSQEFQAVRVMRAHYDDTTEDAYVMRFRLYETASDILSFQPHNRIAFYDDAA